MLRKLLPAALVLAALSTMAVAAPIVNKVTFTPAPGEAAQMTGGIIAGSNQGETVGFEELAKITDAPVEGEPTTLEFENTTPYRWVKYIGPSGSRAMVAELEFYADDKKLEGEPFGIAGQHKPDSAPKDANFTYTAAVDEDPETFFRAPLENDAYVGLDLGTEENMTPRPAIAPEAGTYDNPIEVTLVAPGGNARIYYTKDGSNPVPGGSELYEKPFPVRKGARVRAIAVQPGKFVSPVTSALYVIGREPKPQGYTSFSIGNSLTDTFNGWLEPVAQSAGYDHDAYRFTIPGAPTDWLWSHPGSGFGENNVREAFPRIAPIDFLTTQPFSGHGRSIENEAEHSAKFWNLARETSPEAQLILYAQWPSRDLSDNWSKATQDYMQDLEVTQNAATYEDAAANHMRYFEKLRETIDQAHPGKPVLICPTPPALVKLKAAIESGDVPGLPRDKFFELHFGKSDLGPGYNIHMIEKGRYFVALLLFCMMYEEAPDKVNLSQEITTLTPEQDAVYKKIAWETVRDYAWSGVEAD